ncbi:MAG TPA: glycosyltransferase family 39 protein [Candidatus Dormibacteraeota bacterium]|nr:glycosyltransferase family 39 protein [Candidatus Dormibacteraeota bacterium]
MKKPSVDAWLLGAMILAVGLRGYWALTHAWAVENEGAEYCRLAENLLGGNGYVGVIGDQVQLNFPPLYPILIAAFAVVLRNAELAGRVVALLAGVGLVGGVYLVCRRIYGRRVALIGALIVALHPVFIALSISVYSEGPYIALVILGLGWVLRTATDRRVASGVVAGLLLGLAYLIRPEALVLACALVVPAAALGLLWHESRRAMAAGGAMLLATLVVAAPYVHFLWANTGQLRWEGKGGIAYAIGQRMNQGMSYLEASYGIDENLREEGVHLKTGREVLQSGAMQVTGATSLSTVARYFLHSARRNLGGVLRTVANNRAFGSPLLFLLVLIGLFRTPWSKERIGAEIVLLTAFATSVLILLVGQSRDFRHTLLLLALMTIWAAKGVDELVEWANGTVSAVFPHGLGTWSVGLRSLVILALSGIAFQTIGAVGEFSQASQSSLRQAGLWLRDYAPGPKSIMGTGTTVAYYAGGTLRYLPYADSAIALRYIDRISPNFVVLESVNLRPYIESWVKSGIPTARARLIYSGGEGEDEVMIYEWQPS